MHQSEIGYYANPSIINSIKAEISKLEGEAKEIERTCKSANRDVRYCKRWKDITSVQLPRLRKALVPLTKWYH